MQGNLGNKKIKKMYLGGKKVKKMYLGAKKWYSSGNIVTYRVNPNQSYYEEVEEGKTVLSPTTFTPSMTGWSYLGWRRDTTASATVLTALVMADDPITLYAVFRQAVNLAYNGNGATGGSTTAQSGYRYTNYGNYSNPSFSLRASGYTRSYYAFCGWMLGSTRYQPGVSVPLAGSSTAYAMWRVATLANGSDYCIPASGGWYKRIDWEAEAVAAYNDIPGAIIGGSPARINVYNKVAFDVTYLNSITVRMQGGNIYGHLWAGVSSDPYADGIEAGSDLDYFIEGRNDFTIDVSSMTGYKFFKVVANSAAHGWFAIESITCS